MGWMPTVPVGKAKHDCCDGTQAYTRYEQLGFDGGQETNDF